MKYNAAQTACESFSYGEVEDYTVNIGGAAITSITTKTGIDLEMKKINFRCINIPKPCFFCLERKND
jgi:hypothetical protein